jgi:hypothetical protein
MKSLLLSLLFAAFASTAFCQTSDEESTAIVNLLGVKKKQAMSMLVHVEQKDSAAYWSIYNAYEAEDKKLAKKRIAVYDETAKAYSNMNNQSADSLAIHSFTIRQNQEKLLEQYYNKMKAGINPVVAFQFYQAETYLLTMVRASIMQQIPTYGQVKKMKN